MRSFPGGFDSPRDRTGCITCEKFLDCETAGGPGKHASHNIGVPQTSVFCSSGNVTSFPCARAFAWSWIYPRQAALVWGTPRLPGPPARLLISRWREAARSPRAVCLDSERRQARLNVARHVVPGKRCHASVPPGTAEVESAHATHLHQIASSLCVLYQGTPGTKNSTSSDDPISRPWRDWFSIDHLTRHCVPGYIQSRLAALG